MSFEYWTKIITWDSNIRDKYFKEREFPVYDTMTLVWRKFSAERRKLVVGFIDDMNQHMFKNNQVWTRENLKYLD